MASANLKKKRLSKSRLRFSEQNRARDFVHQNGGAICFTILIGMLVGSLGTRLGRFGIAWDDLFFLDQE